MDSGGGSFKRAFFDIRVFNHCAQSHNYFRLSATCRHHKLEKRSLYYDQWVQEIEQASFTPLVLFTTGGMATIFYKRLASMLSEKAGEEYSKVINLIRCHLSFSLLRRSMMCIGGGGRFPKLRPILETPYLSTGSWGPPTLHVYSIFE